MTNFYRILLKTIPENAWILHQQSFCLVHTYFLFYLCLFFTTLTQWKTLSEITMAIILQFYIHILPIPLYYFSYSFLKSLMILFKKIIFWIYYYYFQSLNVRDNVRDSLEKDPVDRTNQDLDILMEFTQKLEAFNQMTEAVRRALCSVMVFAVVEKAGTTNLLKFTQIYSIFTQI